MNLETLKTKLHEAYPDGREWSYWFEVTNEYVIMSYSGMWDHSRSIVRFEPGDTEDSVIKKFKDGKAEQLDHTHYDLD